jgi:hypothetical protein
MNPKSLVAYTVTYPKENEDTTNVHIKYKVDKYQYEMEQF